MKKAWFKILLAAIAAIATCAALFGCADDEEKSGNEAQYYTIRYIAEAGGRIDGEARQRIEDGGDGTEVIAVPKEGYVFVKWSDDVTTVERTDANIVSDLTLRAYFEKKSFSVKCSTDGNGKIDGNVEQNVKYGENSERITAVPDEGYRFVKWSDGVTTPIREDKNIIASMGARAIFEKIS